METNTERLIAEIQKTKTGILWQLSRNKVSKKVVESATELIGACDSDELLEGYNIVRNDGTFILQRRTEEYSVVFNIGAERYTFSVFNFAKNRVAMSGSEDIGNWGILNFVLKVYA